MQNAWSELEAERFPARCHTRWGPELALAAYSSQLLHREQSLAGLGNGNISVKVDYSNVFGEPAPAIIIMEWGREPVGAERPAYTTLDLAYLKRLRCLSKISDEQLLNELRTHVLDAPGATPPLETLVHCFLPMKYVIHLHAGAISAMVDRTDGCEQALGALGNQVLAVPYCKTGLELAKATIKAYENFPEARGTVWMHQGMLAWGETAFTAYSAAVDLVTKAEEWLEKRTSRPIQVAFRTAPEVAHRRVQQVSPVLRGLLGEALRAPKERLSRMIIQSVTDPDILDLLASARGKELALAPPLTCHYLSHTKPLPMWLDSPEYDDPSKLRGQVSEALGKYAQEYEEYFKRHTVDGGHPNLADAMPRIVLIPGLGALCAGSDLEASKLVRDVAFTTLTVKARIAGDPALKALPEAELFRMEYASREQDGTRPTLPLAGRVALVTGAAGAIGSGISEILLQHGCTVALADLPGERLELLLEDFRSRHGDLAMILPFDVTETAEIADAFGRVVLAWGGVDLVVVNAGVALVSALDQMDIEKFRRLERVNIEGTLNIISQSARHFQLQSAGGDIVLISTKNVFAPGAQFGAYSATKAAAHQLARIASLELAEFGVRVNMVAPDNVFGYGSRRSGLWAEVGPDRARSKGLKPNELEDYYQNRNLLKSRISASDVGNAVLYFATHQSPTTGATIPVDGGLPDATPR